MRRFCLWLARRLVPRGWLVSRDPRTFMPDPPAEGMRLQTTWKWIEHDPPRIHLEGFDSDGRPVADARGRRIDYGANPWPPGHGEQGREGGPRAFCEFCGRSTLVRDRGDEAP